MKFNIDLDTNRAFIQIFGVSEGNRLGEVPIAFQVRGGLVLLEAIANTLVTAIESIADIEEKYHESSTAMRAFHDGMVIFTPGDTPITAIIQMRMVTLVIGSRTLANVPIQPKPLLEAIQTALANVE